ncbi:hypothetical protein ACP70R_037447 [Stipagrostis hirtigluma subsp. patula]
MVIKVYGPAASTNVARVLVCLEEVGLDYELVPVDMTKGEHKSPAHVSRNPFGQVPAFQDGDLILSGTIASNNARSFLDKFKI